MANCTDLNYLIYKECNLMRGQWKINVNITPLTNIVFFLLNQDRFHIKTPTVTYLHHLQQTTVRKTNP